MVIMERLIHITTRQAEAVKYLFMGSEYSLKKLKTPKLGIVIYFIYRGARTPLNQFFIWCEKNKPMLEAMFAGYLESEGSRMTYLEFCKSVYRKDK
jgi:hypothetical protein